MKTTPLCTALLAHSAIALAAHHQPRQATSSTASPSATPTTRNHNVAVGQNGTSFTPTSLKNIPIGDSVTFYFYPSNYSLVQSSFADPCTVLAEDRKATFSGFWSSVDSSTIAAQKFIMRITDTAPMWFYAVDGDDYKAGRGQRLCQHGMVMVINALPKDVGGQTLNAYRKNAATTTPQEICPPSVFGGDVVPVSDRERVRWMSKHPIGGNVKNGTVDGGGANSTINADSGSVATYVNAGATRVWSTALLVFGSGVVLAAYL